MLSVRVPSCEMLRGEEEPNALQLRSDRQNKRVQWLCPLLTRSCLWKWKAKGLKKAKCYLFWLKNVARGTLRVVQWSVDFKIDHNWSQFLLLCIFFLNQYWCNLNILCVLVNANTQTWTKNCGITISQCSSFCWQYSQNSSLNWASASAALPMIIFLVLPQ